MLKTLRRERLLLPIWLVAVASPFLAPEHIVGTRGHLLVLVQFLALFLTALVSAFAVVRHAEVLEEHLPEPLGSLILTLSLVTIEVAIIASVMLSGEPDPTLARDTLYAVIMLLMNGMVGLSLLLGALRHGEQGYNLQGAASFLALILPISVIALVLPVYTHSTTDPTFSGSQSIIIGVATLLLYLVFLALQTTRHRSYFDHPDLVVKPAEAAAPLWQHAALLLAYLAPVIVLAKSLASPIQHGMDDLHLPVQLGGLIIAALILSPESLGAVRAALHNQLQRSINICLGATTANIGLAIPVVLGISLLLGEELVLGLNAEQSLLLALTLMVSMITYTSPRTNALLGLVHLVLFATFIMLIFDDIYRATGL